MSGDSDTETFVASSEVHLDRIRQFLNLNHLLRYALMAVLGILALVTVSYWLYYSLQQPNESVGTIRAFTEIVEDGRTAYYLQLADESGASTEYKVRNNGLVMSYLQQSDAELGAPVVIASYRGEILTLIRSDGVGSMISEHSAPGFLYIIIGSISLILIAILARPQILEMSPFSRSYRSNR